MSGRKSEGQCIENGPTTALKPANSDINFAVPSINLLRNFALTSVKENIPNEIAPGIISACRVVPSLRAQSRHSLKWD